MTWPAWLSAPESFAIGVLITAYAGLLAIVWLLDRRRV